MGERQLRIRALGTTGPVAGAASYNSGLEAHNGDRGLPDLRSPWSPRPGALMLLSRARGASVHFHGPTTPRDPTVGLTYVHQP